MDYRNALTMIEAWERIYVRYSNHQLIGAVYVWFINEDSRRADSFVAGEVDCVQTALANVINKRLSASTLHDGWFQ